MLFWLFSEMIGRLVVVLVILNVVSCQDNYKIGAIFYDDNPDLDTALSISAQLYNFSISVKTVSSRQSFLEIGKHVCSLAEEGVVGIIDGTDGRSGELVQAICDTMEIPHVLIKPNHLYTTSWSQISLYPSETAFNSIIQSIVEKYGWYAFTILYMKGHSINKVHKLLMMPDTKVSVRELSGNDYRDVLTNERDLGAVNFIVDCPSENVEQVLDHAQQVGLMSEKFSYIFLSPDLFAYDLYDYRYGGVNITGFSLSDMTDTDLWDFTNMFKTASGSNIEGADQLKTEVKLIHDAVKVFSKALDKMQIIPKTFEKPPVDCQNYEPWVYGSSLLSFMRTIRTSGFTGPLNFDDNGLRTDVAMTVLETSPDGNHTIAAWENNELINKKIPDVETDITGEWIMKNKTFKILITTSTPPYGYMKETADNLKGNDRFEGFTVDLIAALAEILEFNYEFEVENSYGDLSTGHWTGMVQKLMEEKADFAICDFTITVDRKKAIDFSIPFMTLGIGILYKQPSKQPPELFSFMAPFSKNVWLSILFCQIGLGIVLVFIGRISHKEWQNPVPCIEEPEEFSNQFSFANSVWLIIGSIMQQGSEIAPIAIGPRMLTSVWWFFIMVIVATYTGTLVAFLMVEKDVYPFKSLKELYESNIEYTCKKSGSTVQFFKDSKDPLHQSVYEKMKSHNWFVEDNNVAVDRAENARFAAFMESASIEYYKERHCDLIQAGGLLDSKSYGIGMKRGSVYKSFIDNAILKLRESAKIQKLKDEWWKERRGGGKCDFKIAEEEKQLSMKNLQGAFVVLGVGCAIGLLISILDMLWGVFKKSVKYNTTFKYELIEELKFVIKFSGDVKPVKRPRSEGSAEALSNAEAEEKDEVRSLPSVRSSDTHRTHHSHSSKHSSRSQSVAFAKRREFL